MPFEINVVRGSLTKGRLTFKHGSVSVDTDCWWDSKVRVVAATYTGYATRMANKNDGTDGGKREAIWLGQNVGYAHGTKKSNAIFIHKGTSPAWSDGCIVAAGSEVYKIWSCISPKEQPNVTVVVSDEAP